MKPSHSTLLDRLAEMFPSSSRTTLRSMLAAGRVRLNDRVIKRGDVLLKLADVVAVGKREAGAAPSLSPLIVIYEDTDLLVVDKPAGLLTSTVAGERRPTALAIVLARFSSDARVKIGLVHRLDRDASGLLAFAKSPAAMASLKKQFFDHSAKREYEAIIHGQMQPADGTIDVPLVESASGKVFARRNSPHAQVAITHYRTLATRAGQSLLAVRLETGRKHQIRAHLAYAGRPIVGDAMYGPQPPREAALRLRAVRLVLTHVRSGRTVEFTVEGVRATFDQSSSVPEADGAAHRSAGAQKQERREKGVGRTDDVDRQPRRQMRGRRKH